MDPDRAKRGLSRIPQLTGPPKQTTRRIELSRPVDNVRPKTAAKPVPPVRSKPASRLGATAPKQGASLEARQMARKPASARALYTAPAAPVSREGSLLRKTAPNRETLLARQGSANRQSTAASGKVPTIRSSTGLAKTAAANRPSSSASNRSAGGMPTNRWNSSVAMTPSTGAKPGPSGRLGASREVVLSKKAIPARDATGARVQPSARPASVGKQEVGMKQTGGLRRTNERHGEGSGAAAQSTAGLRKRGPCGQGPALQQQPSTLRHAAQEGAHGLRQGKVNPALRNSPKMQGPSKDVQLSGQLDGTEPKPAPQQQGTSTLRRTTSTRMQGTSRVRQPSVRSTWGDPGSSDSFRSILASPGRSVIRSPDHSSSISTDEVSDTPHSGEHPPAAAELVRNSSNPFIMGAIDSSCAVGSRSKVTDRDVKRRNGQPLSVQHLASRCNTEPSAHPDMDAETSFTGSERSNIAFSPSGRIGEEEMRRRSYRVRSRCKSACSEGGFSDELATRQDSSLSFALESVPSTFDDSDEDVPTGRHSVGQNSTQSCATGELSLKDMNGSHARPKSVDCLKGSKGATEGLFPSRNGGSSAFGTSPLKMPSLGPGNPVRLSIDLSPTVDNSAPSAQSEGDSKSASLLSIGSVTSTPVRTDDGTVEHLHKEIEALKADNSVLTAQIKDLEAKSRAAAEEVVAGLKQDVENLETEKAKLLKGMEAMKMDKQRIQAELEQSQEEVMCVLSETQDADEEVQVYLKRLEEAQGRKELLERDLQRSEGELSKLQVENGKLQARFLELESAADQNKRLSDDNRQLKENLEAEAKAKRDALDESQLAVDKLTKELRLVQETLNSILEENASLKEELGRSPKAAVEQHSSGDESSEASASSANVQKVAQLQDALSLALQVNKCLKERMEHVTDSSSSVPLDSDFTTSKSETELGTMRKVKELEEALNLALEAQDLLEKRVAEHEEVHPGLERLSEDLQNLKLELDEERSRARDEQETLQAMIQELENDNMNKMNDVRQVREELFVALDAKRRAEAQLDAERAANTGLKNLLDGRPAKDFGDLEAVRERGLGGSPALGSAPDVDPSGGSPLSAAKLRAPAEFGDEAQLRRTAVAAVTRLEEMEQELSNAVKEKCDLAQQMVDISAASQELQKVVLETAQITSEISISKERRGAKVRVVPPLGNADDPLAGMVLRAGATEFDVDLSGTSDAEDVSIPAGQLRGMRNEMRRALQEKSRLEAELAERARKSAEFSDEVKDLQEKLKAALAMKEDLITQHEGVKAQLGEENERLARKLEEEKRANAAVEEAVGALYALCKEIESAADIEAMGRSLDEDFPADLPDAVVHITERVREGIFALASRGRASPPDAPVGRDGSEPGTPQFLGASPALGARVRVSAAMGNEFIPEASRAQDMQAHIPELQEVLQEQSFLAGAGRPGSQTGSPMAASRHSRFGYTPTRELQRVMSEGCSRWREVESPYQSASKEGEIRQLHGVMRNMELELEALRQRNEQLQGGSGQGGTQAAAPDEATQRLVGLQTRAQELETHLLQVKLENAELKKAIDQVNGIARGKNR